MRVQVVPIPREISPESLKDRAVAVFDVLRATTTITAALAAGVREIRIFDSIAAAQSAALLGNRSDVVLAGERNCLPPEGFNLGNSPGRFVREVHGGRIVYMATTNGTRAIGAARGAKFMFAGALVNASALAQRLISTGLDITLLCAGTDGESADEDLIGAGAVINAIPEATLAGNVAKQALELFLSAQSDLSNILSQTTGGRNVQAVGLQADIDFAARLDSIPVVGQIFDAPLRVVSV